jgi:tetratricopeptide (TPR) repeat protein
VLADAGGLAAAHQDYEESRTLANEVGDKSAAARAMEGDAAVLREQGDLAGAHSKDEEALTLFRQGGDARGVTEAEMEIGLVLEEQGDVAGARTHLERSFSMSHERGEPRNAAEARLALSRLAIEEERPGEAEGGAREAAEEFRREEAGAAEAIAAAVLAQALVAEGRIPEAQKTMEQAPIVGQHTENVQARFATSIVGAEVRAVSAAAASTKDSSLNPPAGFLEACEGLKSIAAEAKRMGFVGVEFQARLTLGEIEMRHGNPRAGRTRLAALEKQATARGFGLIAHEAEVTRKLRAGP